MGYDFELRSMYSPCSADLGAVSAHYGNKVVFPDEFLLAGG